MERTNKWHVFGCLGNVVSDEEQEDGEGQKDGDAERNLLPGVGRQIEDEHSEERHEYARRDDVDEVVARLALQVKHEAYGREGNAWVGAEELVEAQRLRGRDVPLAVRLVDVETDLRRRVDQVHEAAVVCPVDEVQATRLTVERVERDVELTGCRELPAGYPLHGPIVVDARAELLVGLVVVDGLSTVAHENIPLHMFTTTTWITPRIKTTEENIIQRAHSSVYLTKWC